MKNTCSYFLISSMTYARGFVIYFFALLIFYRDMQIRLVLTLKYSPLKQPIQIKTPSG
jgi:hypothetical protein